MKYLSRVILLVCLIAPPVLAARSPGYELYDQALRAQLDSDYEGGRRLLEEARDVERRHPDPEARFRILRELGTENRRRGEDPAAETHYRQALDACISAHGEDHGYTSEIHFLLGFALVSQERIEEGEEQFARYIQMHAMPETAGSALAALRVANAYHQEARYSWALFAYQRAIALSREENAPRELSGAFGGLSDTLWATARPAEAVLPAREALAVWEADRGKDDPWAALNVKRLADLYYTLGNRQEAQAHYARAARLAEQQDPPNRPLHATLLHWLGVTYLDLDQCHHAAPVLARAWDLMERDAAAWSADPEQREVMERTAAYLFVARERMQARRKYRMAGWGVGALLLLALAGLVVAAVRSGRRGSAFPDASP
jgi:tetratricopeptide (TPR) repeat protein